LSDKRVIKSFAPGSFDNNNHFYPKVLNAELHPLVRFFLSLGKDRVINRYCHLNPMVSRQALADFLNYRCKYLKWAGADLFQVTTSDGHKQTVVIETNSCPSGQKSMPMSDEFDGKGGYRLIIENSFRSMIRNKKLVNGVLAVLYDKNPMEVSGYAATMADVFSEAVYMVPFFKDDWQEFSRYSEDRTLEIQINGQWTPVRAALRYVTQKPWTRIPVVSKTKILNPVVGCLAGGRNKLVAAKAYELFNAEARETGLKINMPHTVYDVSKIEVPLVMKTLGGRGVVKVPYSNAGQGVFTITSEQELERFMDMDFPYDQFIVQALIGNSEWSSTCPEGQLYHLGTVPNKNNEIYVADMRLMVSSGDEGFRPVGFYARRALKPLSQELKGSEESWDMLGTNLSVKLGEDQWSSETNRLILMDRRDFNSLGVGIDQLIDSYIQTVMATIAIDQMAKNLISEKGGLKKKLFQSLNKDDSFIGEIYDYQQ
jgi:hypothetical protein